MSTFSMLVPRKLGYPQTISTKIMFLSSISEICTNSLFFGSYFLHYKKKEVIPKLDLGIRNKFKVRGESIANAYKCESASFPRRRLQCNSRNIGKNMVRNVKKDALRTGENKANMTIYWKKSRE